MPVSLKREQKSDDMIALQRGSKHDFGAILDPAKTIHIEMGVPGKEVDFACFGIDAGGRPDERFFIFYNQTSSPQNEISLEDENANPALFRLELSRLPQTIKRLAFTASLRDSVAAPGAALGASGIDVEIRQNNGGFHLRLPGSDFSAYTSAVAVELLLGSVWRVEAAAAGFNGDLGVLADHFGVKTEEDFSQNGASAEPVVQRDNKIWIDGEEFVLDPANDWV